MTKPNLNEILFKAMQLEDEIIEDKLASMNICKEHYMHGYFKRRYEEKIKRWESLTGRKYENC